MSQALFFIQRTPALGWKTGALYVRTHITLGIIFTMFAPI